MCSKTKFCLCSDFLRQAANSKSCIATPETPVEVARKYDNVYVLKSPWYMYRGFHAPTGVSQMHGALLHSIAIVLHHVKPCKQNRTSNATENTGENTRESKGTAEDIGSILILKTGTLKEKHRGIRYIDKQYRLSIYRHFLEISI